MSIFSMGIYEPCSFVGWIYLRVLDHKKFVGTILGNGWLYVYIERGSK